MVQVISVQPAEGGWAVCSPQFDNPMMFRSGRQAESAARNLGERLSAQGEPAEIQIFLKDGRLGARFICAPHVGERLMWEPRANRDDGLAPVQEAEAPQIGPRAGPAGVTKAA